MSRHPITPKSSWTPYMLELWEKMIEMKNQKYVRYTPFEIKVKNTWELLKIINGEKIDGT